jgi:outer membrane protein assembly factor BamB
MWAQGIFVVAVLVLPVIWSGGVSRQERVLKTAGVMLVTGLLLYLWAIFFSRFSRPVRFRIFLVGLLAFAVILSSVKITGVSGDLVPILAFRWGGSRKVSTATVTPAKTNGISKASFPQFLGPDRNGVIHGVRLEINWTARPPELVWKIAVGAGWSGFSVADGLAFTMEQRGDQELVSAHDLQTGGLVWSHAETTRYDTTIGGEGPRTVPTIFGDKVFSFGATGFLVCVERASGKVIWSKDLVREHAAKVPDWGFASSPLIHDGAVIVSIGGVKGRSLVAHDLQTGKFLWGGGDDSPGYSSPAVLNLAGEEQIVSFGGGHVVGHNLTNGAVLWKHSWPNGQPHVSMPIAISTNQILVSQGYGYGSELLEVSKKTNEWSVERGWKSNRLKSKFANLILYKGFVYGLDDGILTCLDPATGERKWHGERYGHGQLLLVENILLMTSEKGELLLFDPSPDGERVVARFATLKGKMWNPPALAGDLLLVRNADEAACYRLPLAR